MIQSCGQVDMNEQLDGNASYDPFMGTPPRPYDGQAFEYPGGGCNPHEYLFLNSKFGKFGKFGKFRVFGRTGLLPSVGDYPDGGQGNGHWNNNTVDTFSAACWCAAIPLLQPAA